MRALVVLLLLGCALSACPQYAVAATAYWISPEIVVQADLAITPMDMSGKTPDAFEPDDSPAAAVSLRINAEPIDRTIVAGDGDHFVLLSSDGPGYVRIGATAPIDVVDGTGDSVNNGSELSGVDPQPKGVDLLEMNLHSITELAGDRGDARGYMRISTKSKTPVAYRISFVSEMPEDRVGGEYGPGVVAEDYIDAVATGDLTELYRATRTRFTIDTATELRERLFGTTELTGSGFFVHMEDRDADVNALGELPVQHIIVSDEESVAEGRHWAFVLKCEQRNGLWLVADARRDPELTEAAVAAIVQRDLDSEGNSLEGGAGSAMASPVSWYAPALAGVGVVALAGLGVYLRKRRR